MLSAPRGVDRVPLKLEIGDRIHGYQVLRKKWVEERQLMVWELEHEATGAKHVHVECDDTENVFSTILKTIPMNDSGVAHILEHLALCGSKKYPVRDPFFNMLKRSLSTFMNAWTGPDFTGYPFSTTNAKDYYNLLSVYLDAVFFPNLSYYDFLQEGHRLEVNEETQKLEHMGVVFNEMKGAMSDASDLFSTEMHRVLYPSTTYHYNSGGEPRAIRDIQHSDVLAFHKEFYHPSNSYTLTYGDLPLEPQLEFISTNVLQHFSRIQPNSNVADEQRLTKPVRVEVAGPLSKLADPERQTKISVGWLTNNITETYENICMQILSLLLTGGPTSPFYKALIASNIGLTFAPGTGFDPSVRETSFSVGLSEIHVSDVEKVEKIIYEVLEESAKVGFPQERIEAILHQIEFGQKHVSSGFGLNLISSLSHAWLHGATPSETVAINENLTRLRADLDKGGLFEGLIKKHLIDNQHRVTFIMNPDAEYAAREQQEEDESLRKLEATTYNTEESLQKLVEEAQTLEERQEEIPDVSILPKIRISEVSRSTERVPLSHGKVASKTAPSITAPLQFADQPTAGITYMNSLIDITDCPADLLPFLTLFTSSLASVGAGDMDYIQLSQAIDFNAGKFNVFHSLKNDSNEYGKYAMNIGLHSGNLPRNLDSTFDLWEQILTSPRFNDTARLKTLIGNMVHSMQSSMVDSGHSFASKLGSARLTGRGKIDDILDGVSQYHFLKQLHELDDLTPVSDALTRLSKHLLDPSRTKFAINAEKESFPAAQTRLDSLLSKFDAPSRPLVASLPHERLEADVLSRWDEKKNVYFGLQSQVHYVTRVYRAVPYNHEDYTKLDLLGLVMGPNFLHKEIREKGGAYGSGLSHSDNALTFFSYRDPNVEETLDAFERGIEWVKRGEFTDEHLEEAKLQLFSDIDAPTPPSRKGMRLFRSGITDEMAQTRRDRVFKTSKDDVIKACHDYLIGTTAQPLESAITVFGSDQTELAKNSADWVYREK